MRRANGQVITITELGLRHPTARGTRTVHVFDVTDGSAHAKRPELTGSSARCAGAAWAQPGPCPDYAYRPEQFYVYRQLLGIMQAYSPHVRMKSIDEGVPFPQLKSDIDETTRAVYSEVKLD